MVIDTPPRIRTRNLPQRPAENDAEPGLQIRQMSREEYENLPEKPKAEWVDGKAIIMMAPANLRHSDVVSELLFLLKNSLPGLKIRPEAGFRYGNRDRVPDIMAVDPKKAGSGVWVTEPPELIVEIISPATRTQDMVTKSAEYFAAGVGQYWIVDPDLETITVLGQGDDAWDILAELKAENPAAEIKVGNYGTVPLNLHTVLD